MQVIILSVGDELVLGQTVDTNSAWISQQLAAVGISVVTHMTVGDVQADIEAAIGALAPRADAILVSGGIGPTEDDVTRQALAAVTGADLVADEAWLAHLDAWFKRLGRVMPATNRIQAMVPRGASLIWNHNGTAAGVASRVAGKPIFLMPGVPKEMKAMFARDVLPALATGAGGASIVQRTLHTFGAGESTIAERLGDLMKRGRNPSVGTTVAGGVVSVRVNSRFASVTEATEQSDGTCAEVRAALGDLIYGEDGATLVNAVATLLQARIAGGLRANVVTAESCTGGLLAKFLTDLPGSSAYFQRGWVTYANGSKRDELDVADDLLAAHGAVSEPVALAMARGALRAGGGDYALAITGVAGPEGGTHEKPVGAVWIALATPERATARRFVFPGDREMVRDRSAKMALTMLRFELLGRPMPF